MARVLARRRSGSQRRTTGDQGVAVPAILERGQRGTHAGGDEHVWCHPMSPGAPETFGTGASLSVTAWRSPDAVPGGAVAAPQVTVLRWWRRGPQRRPTAGETLSRAIIGAGTVRPQW